MFIAVRTERSPFKLDAGDCPKNGWHPADECGSMIFRASAAVAPGLMFC